jgi:hypothetical protein
VVGTFAKTTVIGGLSMPVAAIALPGPVLSCFPDPDSKNLNRLRLISFRLARTRAYAHPSTRFCGPGGTLIPDPDEQNLMADHRRPGPPPIEGRECAEKPSPLMGVGRGDPNQLSRCFTTRNVYASARGKA